MSNKLSALSELADVLNRLSYDDRMQFAGFIAGAITPHLEDNGTADDSYVANMLSGFVEEFGEDE